MKLTKSPKGLKVTTKGLSLFATLYQTTIVVKTGNWVTLNSGGWKTMHTKKCLNLISNDLGLGFSVSQSKGQWFVSQNGTTVPFVDNIVLKVV